MRFKKLSLVAAVAALAVVGFAIDAGALKMTAKVGNIHKYKMSGEMTLAGMEAKIKANITDKVTKVEDNGNITSISTQSNMEIEFNGSPIEAPDSMTTNVVRPDGTTVEIRSENVSPAEYRIATIQTLKLPDFALAKDKTWTWDCPSDAKTGVVHAKGEYKVLGDEKIHDIDTWKISTKVTELEGDTPASSEATVWISKTDGTMVKLDAKGTNMPFPAAPAPVSGTISIDLIP
jgi:hypothetical protein